jgi:RNA-directed DNA polymerase
MEPPEGNMAGTQEPESVSTKQKRIAELAKRQPGISFTSLNQYLNLDWLREAYTRVPKDKAPGCDGQSVEEYGQNLEENLTRLLEQAKSGLYKAPPVKRVRIPKGDGKETRPIGIPTTEDKVLQRAVLMLLEPIYEQGFYDFSYGFRPGRSAHQALQRIWEQVMNKGIKWILDIDIRKCFDTLEHRWIRELLQLRVRDGVIVRLIGKWLNAGVMEGTTLTYPEEGTPQGGVISPLLANIYLHYVADDWFERMVKPVMKGHAFMVRFADDMVMGFEREDDARRVYAVLAKRFAKYGLTIHPDKTRLLNFGKPDDKSGATEGGPDSFDFLGFTHYWGKSRRGNRVVVRKTAESRLTRGLKKITEFCRKNRHKPVSWQCRKLGQKLKGHFAYFGITGNFVSLNLMREEVKAIWRKWLDRRTRQKGTMGWDRFKAMLKVHPLPLAKVVHSVYRVANP